MVPKNELTTVDEGDDFLSSFMGVTIMLSVMMITMAAILPVLTKQFTQGYTYSGVVDPHDLNADGVVKWLNLLESGAKAPWVTADFHNLGPDRVYIGINNPGPWSEIEKDGSLQVNFLGATRRIETVFYKCDPGNTSITKVVGKY